MITAEFVSNVLQYAKTGERILAAIRTLQAVSSALGSINEADADVAPELAAAIDHLEGLLAALGRAGKFNDARMDVWLDQAKEGAE